MSFLIWRAAKDFRTAALIRLRPAIARDALDVKETLLMQISGVGRRFAYVAAAAVLVAASARVAAAQSHDDHGSAAPASPAATAQQNELIQAVRAATERFKNVTSVDGPGNGFELVFGCVSGGDFGAMGMHFLNASLLGDGDIDVNQPEILLFEPTPNGGIRITGADYVVLAADWNAKHSGPPQLMGQLFHLFDEPNRFGLPAFYTLHVWAWKENPNGPFTNWNPNVSCSAFNPRTAPAATR
jgi:hypothetical protein